VITISVSAAMQKIFDDNGLFQIRDAAHKFTQFGLTETKMVRQKKLVSDMRLLGKMGMLGLIAPELKDEIFFAKVC